MKKQFAIMSDFIKTFFASCLGASLGLVMLLFLIFGIFSAIGSVSSKKEVTDKVLLLDFNHILLEQTGNMEQDLGSFEVKENIGLHDLVRLIGLAKTDKDIDGILLKNTEVGLGQASLLTVMRALEDFKKSKKFIYAYGDYYSQQSYFLATTADSIFLNPNGMIDFKGYSTTIPFFKKGLDDLGVKFDVFYAGDFKSATEPFRRESMSPESKIQTRAFLEGMLDIMQDQIKENRGLDDVTTDRLFTSYEGRTAETAKAAKLVDGISYWSEIESMLKKKIGKPEKDKLKYTTIFDLKDKSPKISKGPRDKQIAVVYAEGEIGYGEEAKGNINEITYQKIFHKIRNNENIKALVLRVNSPGGSAFTSDILWHEIELIKKKGIPVIASFGDYAASGGYYIAAGADTIVSEPNTLTGSIGVFSMLPNAKSLLSDKLGVTFDSVRTHDMAVGYNAVYELSAKERNLFQASTDQIYDQFLDRVSRGRGMSKDAVHAVAQGRVWTGVAGKEKGLVDVIGTLEDAIALAAKSAKLTEYRLQEYPYIKKDPLEQIIKEFSKSFGDEEESSLLKLSAKERELLKLRKQLTGMLNMQTPQARLPFMMEVR